MIGLNSKKSYRGDSMASNRYRSSSKVCDGTGFQEIERRPFDAVRG
jgi:rubrerythrin